MPYYQLYIILGKLNCTILRSVCPFKTVDIGVVEVANMILPWRM